MACQYKGLSRAVWLLAGQETESPPWSPWGGDVCGCVSLFCLSSKSKPGWVRALSVPVELKFLDCERIIMQNKKKRSLEVDELSAFCHHGSDA